MEELESAEPVQVELACGSTMLWKKPGSMTLLSKDEVEPIIPLRMLVENGYMLKWSAAGCEISHPDHGRIRCWRRSGCPVMNREEALKLLYQLENVEKANEIPEVPAAVWAMMKGQGKDWRRCEGKLPWNRRQRRRMESRGVILHIFAGSAESSSRWKDLEDTGYDVVVLDVLRNEKEDMHSPAVWAYLWDLASRGLIRMIYGGPPCRSTSRLRHRQPGPRPVRGRGEKRFGLGQPYRIRRKDDGGRHSAHIQVGGPIREERRGHWASHGLGIPDGASIRPDGIYGRPWRSGLPFSMGMARDEGLHGQVRHGEGMLRSRWYWTFATKTHDPSDEKDLQQLEGIRAKGGRHEPLEEDLQKRMQQTSTWASWSPGLVSAVKVAIREFVKGGASPLFEFSLWSRSKSSGSSRGRGTFADGCRGCSHTSLLSGLSTSWTNSNIATSALGSATKTVRACWIFPSLSCTTHPPFIIGDGPFSVPCK